MPLASLTGLFDWSIKYQDGTHPSEWDPDEYDPEKMKWCACFSFPPCSPSQPQSTAEDGHCKQLAVIAQPVTSKWRGST